jgi:hypothetical protein
VERNGRERLLDDALTSVHPVFSPDSSKIACAFDKQIRIYDSRGVVPTQAAIPLLNHLLISSQAYDNELQRKAVAEGEAVESTPPPASQAGPETLPDGSKLVSFNPIIFLHWESDGLLYFQTAAVRRMLNDADSVFSFARWHRLVFSPQARTLPN